LAPRRYHNRVLSFLFTYYQGCSGEDESSTKTKSVLNILLLNLQLIVSPKMSLQPLLQKSHLPHSCRSYGLVGSFAAGIHEKNPAQSCLAR
jgi:hypothetical protein